MSEEFSESSDTPADVSSDVGGSDVADAPSDEPLDSGSDVASEEPVDDMPDEPVDHGALDDTSSGEAVPDDSGDMGSDEALDSGSHAAVEEPVDDVVDEPVDDGALDDTSSEESVADESGDVGSDAASDEALDSDSDAAAEEPVDDVSDQPLDETPSEATDDPSVSEVDEQGADASADARVDDETSTDVGDKASDSAEAPAEVEDASADTEAEPADASVDEAADPAPEAEARAAVGDQAADAEADPVDEGADASADETPNAAAEADGSTTDAVPETDAEAEAEHGAEASADASVEDESSAEMGDQAADAEAESADVSADAADASADGTPDTPTDAVSEEPEAGAEADASAEAEDPAAESSPETGQGPEAADTAAEPLGNASDFAPADDWADPGGEPEPWAEGEVLRLHGGDSGEYTGDAPADSAQPMADASDKPAGDFDPDDQARWDEAPEQEPENWGEAPEPDGADKWDDVRAQYEAYLGDHRQEAANRLDDLEASGYQVEGDPRGRLEYWRPQGDNDRDYRNDCSLAATSAGLRSCGLPVSEGDVVDYAHDNDLCWTGESDPRLNGGSNLRANAEIFDHFGVDSDLLPRTTSPQELADYAAQGRHVQASVNAGELWAAAGEQPSAEAFGTPDFFGRYPPNHAITVTGSYSKDGELAGLIYNDTGSDTGAGRPMSLADWNKAFTRAHGPDDGLWRRGPRVLVTK